MTRKSVHFDNEIFLRGTVYWYRGYPFGRNNQVERSLKLKVGAPQRDVLAAKKALLDSLGILGNRVGSTSFKALATKYIEERKKEGLASKTIFETTNVCEKHLMPFFRNYRVEEINQPLFSQFCEVGEEISFVPHRKVLNHFLKWCFQNGYLKYRMQLDIPKFARKAKRQRAVLTEREILEILKNLGGRPLLYHAMYLLMGMRNSEIIKLAWDDVSFEKVALRINPLNNKTRQSRVVPINSMVLELLKSLDHQGSPWVFPGASKNAHANTTNPFRAHWNKALKAARVDRHLTRHDLRATFETFMHVNSAFTDTQREKMAGAKIDVQKRDYVTMRADHLRGLEESVQVEGLDQVLKEKIQEISRAKPRAKAEKESKK